MAEGRPWILMELLDGCTLQQRVAERGPLPVTELVSMFEQLCHGLAAAHARHLVHRDLKPENVFVHRAKSAQGGLVVKVLDFGVAKALDPLRRGGTASIAVGTQGWWAPEQVFGGTVSPATDVWSLGLLAYWCLTGRLFHDTGLPHQQMLAAASARAGEQGVGERIPPGFDAWFAQCVAWEPSQRFVDAGVAWRALEATLSRPSPATAPTVLASPPPRVMPVSAPYAPTPTAPPVVMYAPTRTLKPKRTRTGWVTVSALVVSLASIGGWWLLHAPSGSVIAAPMDGRDSPPTPAPAPVPIPATAVARRPLWERPDLQSFFGRWDQTLGAISRGEGANVGEYYAEQTRFRGSGDTLRTHVGVGAYWDMFFHQYAGTIRFDWTRAAWDDETLDPSRTSHSACALVVDAEPGVILVRVPAVEDDPQSGVETIDGTRCTHLEGIYLLRARRVRASFQICHESWSLDEAICPSCPTARQCPH